LRMSFEKLSTLHEENVKALEDYPEYFSSDEYSEEKRLAELVFNKVKSKCEIFLAMVKGPIGSSGIGDTEIERAMRVMCFPVRYLNQPSTAAMPDGPGVVIEDIIEETFFLGLMCHLGLTKFPTRSDVQIVDMDALFDKWILSTLISDTKMRTYDKEYGRVPSHLFESLYRSNIEPVLKEQFGFGFWKRGKSRTFFRNLFFAGACLGMHCDLMTTGEP